MPKAAPVPDDSDLAGRTIGPYRLLRRLGQGGMGVVYEACEPGAAAVALKLLRERPLDTDSARRFDREARAAMAVAHRNVVRVLAAGADDASGHPYFAMELLVGSPLDVWLRRLRPLDPPAACRLFADACEGLGAVHERGLVHRDVKPANLFVHEEPGGEACIKLCDFGVAKQLDTSQAQLSVTDLTTSGGLLGSPMYMSPEQARDGSRVDARSDLWSLCLSLHEALSGVRPWQGCRTVGELLLAIHTVELPRLRDLAPWVPAPLAAAVERGLRRDPAERWPGADALRSALLPFAAPSPLPLGSLRAADISSLPPSAGSTWESQATRTPTPRPRAPLLAAGASVGAALLLLLALRTARPAAAPAGAPAAASSVPEPQASAQVEGRVRLSPADARARVRGQPADAPGGQLVLRGLPGERVEVQLQQGERTETFRVMLGLDGIPTPDQLTLPPPSPAPSASAAPAPPQPARPGRVAPAASAAPAPAAASATAAPAASMPRMRGFDELSTSRRKK